MDLLTLRTVLTADPSGLDAGLAAADAKIDAFLNKQRGAVQLPVAVGGGGGGGAGGGYATDPAKIQATSLAKLEADLRQSQQRQTQIAAEGAVKRAAIEAEGQQRMVQQRQAAELRMEQQAQAHQQRLVQQQEAFAQRQAQTAMNRQGLNQSIDSLQNSGYRQLRAGSILTATFTAPLVGAGALLSKFTADFDENMQHVIALTGVARGELAGLREDVLALTDDPRIRQGPAKLADALYYVTSSGLDGPDGMQVLKASALGASAGLGEAKTVANTVTTVLDAYGLSADKAARVTDTLTEAVKQGKGEADKYAAAFPKVVAIAAQAGVSFEEVAAQMAAATRVGLTPSETATALRQIFNNLIDPSEKATRAMKQLGTSVEEIRSKLRLEGLFNTLKFLMERTHGDIGPITELFGSIRALTSFLSTTGTNTLKSYQEILQATMGAEGSSARSAAIAAETFTGKLEHLKAVAEATAIRMGTSLMPVLTKVADELAVAVPRALHTAIAVWEQLPAPVQTTVKWLTALLALTGPINVLAGTIKILAAGMLGLGESTGILTAINAIRTQFSAGLAFGLPGAGAAISSSFAPLVAVATNPYVLAFLAGTAVIGGTAWLAFSDNLRAVAKAEDELARNTQNLNSDFTRLGTAASGNDNLVRMVRRITDAARDAKEDVAKLRGVLDDITQARHDVRGLKLDPVTLKVMQDDFERLAMRIEQRIIKVKIAADASSNGFMGWLSDLGTGASSVAYNATGGLLGSPERPKVYDTSGSNPMRKPVVPHIPPPPGFTEKGLQDLVRAATLSEVLYGQTAVDRLKAMNRLNLDTLSESSLKRVQDSYARRIKYGYQPTEAEDKMLGDLGARYRQVVGNRQAEENKRRLDQESRERERQREAQKVAEDRAKQLRQVRIEQLQADTQQWNSFKTLADGIGVEVERIGDKSKRTATEAALLKDGFANIPAHLRASVLELASFHDQLSRVISLRDKMRGVVGPAFIEARDLGMAPPTDAIRRLEASMDLAGSITAYRDTALKTMRQIDAATNLHVAGNKTAIKKLQKTGGLVEGVPVPPSAANLARMDSEGMDAVMRLLGVGEPPAAWGAPVDKVSMQPGESRAVTLQIQNLLRDQKWVEEQRDAQARRFRDANWNNPQYRGKSGRERLDKDAAGAFDRLLPFMRDIGEQFDSILPVGQFEEALRQKTRELETKARLIAEEDNPISAFFDELEHSAAKGVKPEVIGAHLNALLGSMKGDLDKFAREFARARDAEIAQVGTANLLDPDKAFNRADYDKARAMVVASQDFDQSPLALKYGRSILGLQARGRTAEAEAQADELAAVKKEMLHKAEIAYQKTVGEGSVVAYSDAMQAQREAMALMDHEAYLLERNAQSREALNDALEVEKTRRDALKGLQGSFLSDDIKQFLAAYAADQKAAELAKGRGNQRTRDAQDYAAATQRNLDLLREQTRVYATMPAGSPALELAQKDAEIEKQLRDKFAGKMKDGKFVNPADELQFNSERSGARYDARLTQARDATRSYGEAIHGLDRDLASLGDTTGLVAARFDLMRLMQAGAADTSDLLGKRVTLLQRSMAIETSRGILGQESQFNQGFYTSNRARLLEEIRLRNAEQAATEAAGGAPLEPAKKQQQEVDDRARIVAAEMLDRRHAIVDRLTAERDIMLTTARTEEQRVAINQNILREMKAQLGLQLDDAAEFRANQDKVRLARAMDAVEKAKHQADILSGALEDGIRTGFDKGAVEGLRAFANRLKSDVLGEISHKWAQNLTRHILGDPRDKGREVLGPPADQGPFPVGAPNLFVPVIQSNPASANPLAGVFAGGTVQLSNATINVGMATVNGLGGGASGGGWGALSALVGAGGGSLPSGEQMTNYGLGQYMPGVGILGG